MKNAFTYATKVGFSQTDINEKMTIPAIIDAFQDVSCFQADTIGVGQFYLKPLGLSWILNFWEIEIERCPSYFDNITLGTFPYAFNSLLGMRNFFLLDEKGEMIVKANSLWAMMDWKKNTICRLDEKVFEKYVLDEKLDMTYSNRHLKPRDGAQIRELEKVNITKQHLDFNGHVNNAQYVKIAMQLIEDREYHHIRVEYKLQAHEGDIMCPELHQTDTGVTLFLNNPEGKAFAILDFE